MKTLGEDLALLGRAPDGTVLNREKLAYALAGAQLVQLVALGRVTLARKHYTVAGRAATGDPLLDAALADLAGRRNHSAADWVGRARPTLAVQYLERLADAGAVREESYRVLGLIRATRWPPADPARFEAARRLLAEAAEGRAASGSPAAALGGLAAAAGLHDTYYPGRANAQARRNLRERRTGLVARTSPAPSTSSASAASASTAAQARTAATADAAITTAVDATTDAAINTAVDEAIRAAIDAAIDATSHAVHAAAAAHGHDGGAAGHH